MKINNQRWWDVPAALFLLGALFTAAVRLQVTNWTENLGRVEFIVILGAIFGFALGKSIFDGRITFALGTVYSLFVIPWQLGQMIPNLDWLARLNILYARLWYATADFLSNKPVRDPILFFDYNDDPVLVCQFTIFLPAGAAQQPLAAAAFIGRDDSGHRIYR